MTTTLSFHLQTLTERLNKLAFKVVEAVALEQMNAAANATRVATGIATLMNLSGSPTAAELHGNYGLLANWWTTGTQQAWIGTINFDGVSKVNLSYVQQQGPGSATTGTGSGAYSVVSDGSGSIILALSNKTTKQFDFVPISVSGSVAQGVLLLDTSISKAVGTGTAAKE